MKHTDLLKANT